MNLSRPFIRRPIATILLTIGLALAGIAAFLTLPVARLPAVDFPVIFVSASMPGASPADMARTVATPLERRLGTIAGVNQMTSSSSTGSSRVVLQFDLNRNIDSAARDVQAAINAARIDLPANLRSNPTYRKANPAAQPFMILALTSRTRSPGQIFDAVNNIVSQRLLQVPGVGDVTLGGGSQPAVRVELNPFVLHDLGISSDDVRAALQSSNANRPKGVVETGGAQDGRAFQVLTPAPGLRAADYRDLVVAVRDGAEVRLSQVATVSDSVQDVRTRGMFNGQPAIVVNITQQPDANLIATADAIEALLPQLRAQLPQDVQLQVAIDRTGSVRGSVHEVEITLAVAVLLVVLVVGLFLGNLRAALIPAVATVVSLLGTFAVMAGLGYSLNNLTLMALTVATGFVVDDAIVVIENISRHLEQGVARGKAALDGAREVGFTVLTISVSLVAVFIPLLFMGGQPGRLFREFAVTLSVAVMISLVISLTTTPMLCALLLPAHQARRAADAPPRRSAAGWLRQRLGRGWGALMRGYGHALDWTLAFPWLVVLVLAVVVALSGYLFVHIQKGYFPDQDNGQFFAGLRADQSISSLAFGEKLQQAADIIGADPSVGTIVAYAGGRSGGGFLFGALKPAAERPKGEKTRTVINRLRPRLATITGLSIFLNPAQELRMGGRSSNATYQYTLKADSQGDLKTWTQRLAAQLKQDARLSDIDDDMSDNGVETFIEVDRAKAASLGIAPSAINDALYNAFGQRQVATMYSELNQYSVIMEWAPRYAQSPATLRDVMVPAGKTSGSVVNPALRASSTGAAISTSGRTMVPLSEFARFSERAVPASVFHDGGELSSTLSFNLADGVSEQQGRQAVLDAVDAVGMPNKVRGAFDGALAMGQQQQSEQGLLILAAVVVIYLVLGMLYESLIHPLTVLTTLPSAGFGAALALMLLKMEFSIMALIGVFLLIGIVKKNAILIIDFAIEVQRTRGLGAVQAVREACLLRFRPILMTTLAAGLGALPLAVGFGEGAELRQPLGVTIVGGLIASQLLTLLTTPAVYVLLDKLRRARPEAAPTHRPALEGA
ncbi:efflux RND transporter permease subunit [Comamonas flocculans]|uniref:MMPL family transporter n=1 Tax=Comamonas flocculans TaxID=2597701 RepID=A0A5B8RV59_9BURK|nr:efflux RND transporter permease subunit [Comamonas flocculans]QEA11657.1 MMPL family transporter [Comamonas flocculans]